MWPTELLSLSSLTLLPRSRPLSPRRGSREGGPTLAHACGARWGATKGTEQGRRMARCQSEAHAAGPLRGGCMPWGHCEARGAVPEAPSGARLAEAGPACRGPRGRSECQRGGPAKPRCGHVREQGAAACTGRVCTRDGRARPARGSLHRPVRGRQRWACRVCLCAHVCAGRDGRQAMSRNPYGMDAKP